MAQKRGFSKARLGRLSAVMAGYVERGQVAGLVTLLARHAATHLDVIGVQDLASGAPMRRDTIFRIASMTKPIAAAAAMMLVEETRLRLDDPVDRWLPELADRKVLRAIESPLDDTVPAVRPISLRDLLTFRLGLGAVMAPPGTYPIQRAMAAAGLAPGPKPPQRDPDAWMKALGELPLIHQPGTRWMYHTGADILGVLIARAAGMRLEDFLAERVFAPLGMVDTGFFVPEGAAGRLAACYQSDPATGGLKLYDDPHTGLWSRPPPFASAGGGLVSTADDFLAFARMMLAFGRAGTTRLLARPSVALMTTDQITPEQKSASPFFPGFWDSLGWGFGLAMVTRRVDIGAAPGQYGWQGGFSTVWANDPAEDLTAILLTQRVMGGPDDDRLTRDFLTLAYQAIDD